MICVGGTDSSYTRHPESNFADTVTGWAPFDGIVTFGNANDQALVRQSGNSFTTPHASGAAANIVAREWLYNAWTTPAGRPAPMPTVLVRLFGNALRGAVQGLQAGSNNFFFTTGIKAGESRDGEPYPGGGRTRAERRVNNPLS